MIVCAVPTRDVIAAPCVGDLIRLCRRHPDLRFLSLLGIYISNLRQSAVQIAQQAGASHVLFVDSDMRFPDDTLDRLLAADVDVIAANCVQRTAPQWWTARANGQWLSSVGRTGRQLVDAVGFGVMLIRLTVFDQIPRPWFDTPYDGQTHVGEDLTFCRKAEAAGYLVWIDHDLSQHVRHLGTVELGIETYAGA